MTADELVELAARPGHRLGAHGSTHAMLTRQTDDVKAVELASNRADLQQLLGVTVDTLAYPYGACDLRTTEIAGEVGFALACSVDPDPVTADSDPLRLPRLEVHGEDIESFRFLLEQTSEARR
jgi:peptidoglycan/xylan/chitin deacetylase (PgdA/CDA1 family)